MEHLSASQRRELQKGFRLRARFVDAVTIDLLHPGEYRVRSETGNGFYRMRKVSDEWFCECKAFEELQDCCKHIWAVRIGLEGRQELAARAGGQIPKYGQDWPAYDAAQQNEYLLFDPLLWSLLDDIPEPIRPPGKRGRNPISLRTQLLMAIKKVHLGKSCLRSRGLIRSQFASGNAILPRVPNYAVPSRAQLRQSDEPLLESPGNVVQHPPTV
jgi:SWIM zinc finger